MFQGAPRWGKLGEQNQVDLAGGNALFDGLFGASGFPSSGETCEYNADSLISPVPRPNKVICVGKNYADHASEMGSGAPELPIIFSKFSSAVVGPNCPVEIPAIATQVDYEAELVVVIGKPGKNIPRLNALGHVLGYTCGNDVSARDWQKGRPGGQWLLGKTFDSFAPVGPWLVTADEIENPHELDVSLTLNGEKMQSASTSSMLYPVDQLISHCSQFFTLEFGDLIFTGTPAGVGAGRNPPVFLKAGDETCVSISKLGDLKTRFVAPADL
ncbi:MAG: fumarylacetoacetate hydrolase family protein [Pirellulaceae bacterium]